MAKPVSRLVTMHSIAEFADRIEVSTKSVQRWVAKGDLRVHRFGRVVRISEEDARAFIAARRT